MVYGKALFVSWLIPSTQEAVVDEAVFFTFGFEYEQYVHGSVIDIIHASDFKV